ncbi:hypothetical protein [Actinomadura sp. SCN-SB]|uniref:hypothetical protein n=1 Tax=Actinomadura sp. SCN-SB TaxID=3373092 RepID=UPI003751D003
MARGPIRVHPRRSSPVTPSRLLTPLAFAAVLPLALSGCGSPDYHYVKNSEQKTYFKVPSEWHRIDQRTLDGILSADDPDSAAARARPRLVWSVAYDAHEVPHPTHLYGVASDQPFVWAVVRPLSKKEQDAVSLDMLRDTFLPVTENGRAELAQRGGQLAGFELTRDQVLTPGGGLRGVRTTFNYRLPTSPDLQTFDVTAYVSDAGRLYVMVLRCSTRCFHQRAAELDAIARSFTVRND